MLLTKKTSLQTSDDIGDTLNWKLKIIMENKMPTESGIADYISLAIENLEREIKYIESVETDYKTQKKYLSEQIKSIKIEGAEFFQNNGIIKVEGIVCSSITIVDQKDAETTTSSKKVFTPLISPAEIEELLIGLGKAEMKTISTDNTSNFIPAKLRVNKRKADKR